MHLASWTEVKNLILTDAASLEVSGCQSTPCCWTLTFLPSVSHCASWQSKAGFRSLDYNSWIIHTRCTFILHGPGVGWLDSGEKSFCLTVAAIPGNSLTDLWCQTQFRIFSCPAFFFLYTFSRTDCLLIIPHISGLYVKRAIAFLATLAIWFYCPLVSGLAPNFGPDWKILTIDGVLPWRRHAWSLDDEPNGFGDPLAFHLTSWFGTNEWLSGHSQPHFVLSSNQQLLTC